MFQGAGVPRHSAAIALGAFHVAIENHQVLRADVGQVSQRFLGHFAGADHEHLFVVEPLEDPRGEVGNRHAGNAEAMAVERGFVGHAPGDAHGRLEQVMRHGPGAADPPANS